MRPPRTVVAPHTDDRDTGIARIRGILAEENLDGFSNDELLNACIDLAPSHNAEPDAVDHQITHIQEMIDEDHLDEFSNDQLLDACIHLVQTPVAAAQQPEQNPRKLRERDVEPCHATPPPLRKEQKDRT